MSHIIKICTSCSSTFETGRDILNKGKWIYICDSGNLWFNCSCDSTLFIPKGKFECLFADIGFPDLYFTNAQTEQNHIKTDSEWELISQH